MTANRSEAKLLASLIPVHFRGLLNSPSRLRESLHPCGAAGVLNRKDAKLLASLIPDFAVLPRMVLPSSGSKPTGAINKKAFALAKAFLFIGSLHIPRRARDCSVGGQQNCLLSERPTSLCYSTRSKPPGSKYKKPQSFDWGSFVLGALISLAELGIVPSEERQTVGVLKPRRHCATLREQTDKRHKSKKPTR